MPATNTATSASRTTRCPECQTTFRVTDSQLAAAAGMVRCGTCMHVFNASLHWTQTTPGTLGGVALLKQEAASDPDWQPPDAANTAAPAPLQPLPEPEDDFEFSDSFLALSGTSSDAPEFDLYTEDEPALSDGSEEWARALLAQEESTPPAHRKEILDTIAAVAKGESQNNAAAARPTKVMPSNVPSSQQFEPRDVQSAEKWMQTLLGGDEAPQAEKRQSPPPAAAIARQSPAAGSEPTDDYIPEIFRKQQPAAEPRPPVTPAPAPRRRRPAGALWLAGSVAGALLLLAQYGWFNAAELGRKPALRPAITLFCAVTRCQMPAPQDLGRIDNSNLMVFKHPTVAGALVLDTVLTNLADFEQAFPLLKVTFSNFQDQIIAQRVFHPREYLGSEIGPDALMPRHQPVHLSLALADPGEQAVNYKLELLPNR